MLGPEGLGPYVPGTCPTKPFPSEVEPVSQRSLRAWQRPAIFGDRCGTQASGPQRAFGLKSGNLSCPLCQVTVQESVSLRESPHALTSVCPLDGEARVLVPHAGTADDRKEKTIGRSGSCESWKLNAGLDETAGSGVSARAKQGPQACVSSVCR